MTENDTETGQDRHGLTSRRRFLAVTSSAAAIGVTGCAGGSDESETGDPNGTETDGTGGTDDSGDSGDDESGGGEDEMDGDGTTAGETPTEEPTPTPTPEPAGNPAEGDPDFCGRLNEGGYSRFESSGSPFVATFEVPESASGPGTAGYSGIHEASFTWYIDDDTFSMFVYQTTEGESEQTASMLGERDGLSVVSEITFNGETVPVVEGEPDADDPPEGDVSHNYPYYIAGLPHDVDGETRYFRFGCRENQQYQDSRDPPICVATWRMVARHIVESAEPNPDTSIESE